MECDRLALVADEGALQGLYHCAEESERRTFSWCRLVFTLYIVGTFCPHYMVGARNLPPFASVEIFGTPGTTTGGLM